MYTVLSYTIDCSVQGVKPSSGERRTEYAGHYHDVFNIFEVCSWQGGLHNYDINYDIKFCHFCHFRKWIFRHFRHQKKMTILSFSDFCHQKNMTIFSFSNFCHPSENK